MRREDLAHVLRAAARIAGDNDILVIGSQAILGSYWEDQLPEAAWRSIEADVAFVNDSDARKADLVDGAIGELSEFHRTNSFYAQGVEVTTAILPAGWRDRLVRFTGAAAEPASAVCLDPHDLVVSKLAAQREKDFAFASALLHAGLIDPAVLLVRARLLPDEHGVVRAAVVRWIESSQRTTRRPNGEAG